MAERLFLPPRECPFDPPEILRQQRSAEPVSRVTLWNGKQAWMITRYSDADAVLHDRRFSADPIHENMPSLTPAQDLAVKRWINMSRLDEPTHAELRRPLSPEFAASRLEQFRPSVQRIVDAQIDQMLEKDPPVDFISTFARSVPALVVTRLLGVPEEDIPLFHRYALLALTPGTPVDTMNAADDELYDCLDRLITKCEWQPGDNLLGRLVVGGQVAHKDLIDAAWVSLIAGHVTTASTTGLIVLSLLTDPDLFRTMRERPELAPKAVEEFLRYHTIVQYGLRRVATEDVTIAGTLVRAGDGVLIMIASANRDEQVFPNPDHLDIHRTGTRHLSFGIGPHICLGQWLARLELQTTARTLVRRVPTLRLAVPFEELRFQEDRTDYGVHELPVTW